MQVQNAYRVAGRCWEVQEGGKLQHKRCKNTVWYKFWARCWWFFSCSVSSAAFRSWSSGYTMATRETVPFRIRMPMYRPLYRTVRTAKIHLTASFTVSEFSCWIQTLNSASVSLAVLRMTICINCARDSATDHTLSGCASIWARCTIKSAIYANASRKVFQSHELCTLVTPPGLYSHLLWVLA